jgi:hypothetical protein
MISSRQGQRVNQMLQRAVPKCAAGRGCTDGIIGKCRSHRGTDLAPAVGVLPCAVLGYQVLSKWQKIQLVERVTVTVVNCEQTQDCD